ncbi:twin-arginine translocation signal domain-containing protein [Dyella mobilis]|uniref:Twin-arginine translocation signal domain-containing protein n=1 Tax=Dyella mobilis TaxID=1849582 RepID=A0ABS2KIY7_9GAMM|nr:twin-arginine translocation signal domain-containing protein [Dyella mobilis]MBM7131139.1 twin-arginine translocation signal domain-containing protein [Dyella mobilis]
MRQPMSRRDFLGHTIKAAGAAALVGLPTSARPFPSRAAKNAVSGTAWMQNNIAQLGSRTLRELCMPGTHDAGMSALNSGTAFAYTCNTVTQTNGILGQLQNGSRYFDIRPVISGGQYVTGHYSEISQLNSWQGGNGQSIASIIDDVNTFTASNDELVILYLSHDLDTDLGNSSYAALTQAQWDSLLQMLQQGLDNLYTDAPIGADLTTLTLGTFIGNDSPAVIVVVDPSASGISLGSFAGEGFYLPANFPVYNQYSDTNDLSSMVSDQLAKMAAQRPNPQASYFLLSWTLTQSSDEAVFCDAGLADGILTLANQANAQLSSQLLPACSAQTFPNIVYIDNLTSSVGVVSLAMQINGLS